MIGITVSLPGGVVAAEPIDVAVSEGLGCALYNNGAVYCWGYFPDAARIGPLHEATRIEPLPPAISIAAGRFGACAADAQGVLRCWGLDFQRTYDAKEVVGGMTPFVVRGLPSVTAASLGYNHVCALSQEGQVWCWGLNPFGAVGCGDTEPRIEPVKVDLPAPALSVSAGVGNTCAPMENGQAACWGSDNPTSRGQPFIYESLTPVFLDPEKVGLFRQIANGRNFACGLRQGGRVTCWGSDAMGQVGSKKPRLRSFLAAIGEVDGVKGATDLDAGYFYACVVAKGQVRCWGSVPFEKGGPMFGSAESKEVPGIGRATRIGTGEIFACAVAGGKVVCWGDEDPERGGPPLFEGMRPDRPVPVPGLPG